MKKFMSIIKALIVLLTLSVFCSCDKSEDCFYLKGVKVGGNSWVMKQSFLNQGYWVVKETEDVIFLESNLNDKNKSYIHIFKGKYNRVLAARMSFGLRPSEDDFESLKSELISEYGNPRESIQTEDGDTLKWGKFNQKNELTSYMELSTAMGSMNTGVSMPRFEFDKNGNVVTKEGDPFIYRYISEIVILIYNYKNLDKYSRDKKK